MVIALYFGSGAVLAKDVAAAFKKLNISYEKITEKDIENDKLKDYSILIIPGGYTPECVKALMPHYEKIRDFVAKNAYIGICMGTYLAPDKVELSYLGQTPKGLGIIDIVNERGKGKELRKIYCREHEITKGYKEIEDFCETPPLIKAGENVEILAKYNGHAALVYSDYKEGKVILFSFHPEKLNTTLSFLKNAILFAENG